MARVIGLDIGGANIKATFIRTRNGSIEKIKTVIDFFPIWKRGKELLPEALRQIIRKLNDFDKLDCVGVTMTAELSDAYWTKKTGVNHVLDCTIQVFENTPIFVLNVEARLISIKEATSQPLSVAAANWSATGWLASQFVEDCIIIDVGSTTTSIIPVIEGKIVAAGKTDLEKLVNGELVYTGSLRTNVATIVSRIPVRNGTARVSSERFSLSGDVHLILGSIIEEEYTTETADCRGKTRKEAMARLARVVCADIETLTEREIHDMAKHIHEAQIKQIIDGLKQVYDRMDPYLKKKIPIIIAGLGRNFLAKKAAKKMGFSLIVDFSEITGIEASIVSPSVGVALMAANEMERRNVKWMR